MSSRPSEVGVLAHCLGTLVVLNEPHPLFPPLQTVVYLVYSGFAVETVFHTVIVSRSRG